MLVKLLRTYHKEFFTQLNRTNVSQSNLCHFYIICIRTVIHYAAPVFHFALPLYLVRTLTEARHAHYLPNVKYRHVLSILGLTTINDHQYNICTRTINSIVNVSEHKLSKLFRKPFECSNYNLRHVPKFAIPRYRTSRFRGCFIIKSAIRANNSECEYITVGGV